ncbi:hypothetical protein [Paracoccus homiensis]|uniref:Uncharacterized protein n=1 Tax=Paracoccus homiensis TaxID=364199 RepID=A0A1I0DNY9_9RHOB|nr:hypothetical protein [Paracoccus homiensis]SET33930.1 hypothetical protein SAMN04489858_104223 [Paracoccus homiensis]
MTQSRATDAPMIAGRRLIQHLATILTADQIADLDDWLASRSNLHDGQEDPGAVIADGLDLELAVALSFGRLGEALQQAVAANKG